MSLFENLCKYSDKELNEIEQEIQKILNKRREEAWNKKIEELKKVLCALDEIDPYETVFDDGGYEFTAKDLLSYLYE